MKSKIILKSFYLPNKNSKRIEKNFIESDGFGFDFCKVDECTLYFLIIISYFIEHVSWIAQNAMVC